MPVKLRPVYSSFPNQGGLEYTAYRMALCPGAPVEVGNGAGATSVEVGEDAGIVTLGTRAASVLVASDCKAVSVGAGGVIPSTVSLGGAGGTVGFFGSVPVAQQPAPVLLTDVITGLQNLGLFAT